MNATIHTVWSNIVLALTPQAGQPLMFQSGLFWVLMVLFLPVLAMVRHRRAQTTLFVTAFSLFFFYESSGWYFLLLVGQSLADWWLALRIATSRRRWLRRTLMWLSVALSAGLLCLFKYTNFFLRSWHDIAGGNFQPLDIVVPIGVSFYTFRTISYVVDVHKRRMAPVRSWPDYLFFLSFFPCLVAGPIVRARDFMPQLRNLQPATKQQIYGGMWQVLLGIVKKAVVADYLAQYTAIAMGNPGGYSGFELLVAAVAYSMQIYCDFSGYSDMAIGLGSIMGFDLGKNFDFPYRSLNITEFWRRWHISLSSWLRDYVYIPLGGNRRGRALQLLFLLITMLVGGLWHGASVTFVVWGAMHGVALCVHKLAMPWLKRVPDTAVVRVCSGMLTFTVVTALWIFFAAGTEAEAWAMLTGIATRMDLAYVPPFVTARWLLCIMLVCIVALHFVPQWVWNGVRNWWVDCNWWLKLASFITVVQLVVDFASADVRPFIYAQF